MNNYQRGFKLNAVWFLIGANVLLFIATILQPQPDQFRYDAGFQPVNFSDRPWTILTSFFIHVGYFHVFFNMVTLYFFGTYLLRLIGENKFLVIYFLGGIIGNVFYYIYATYVNTSFGHQYSTIIGASGAIFAVGGALTVLLPRLKVIIFPIPVPVPLWIALAGTFLIVFLFPNVAWQAHLGGLLIGLAAGFIFKKRMRNFLV